jgi:hypothetical protein
MFLLLNYSGAATFEFLEFNGTGTVIDEGSYGLSGTTNNSANVCFDEYKDIIMSFTSGGVYRCTISTSPVAQNLLPAATTKTSANTMKITYTFNLDLSGL